MTIEQLASVEKYIGIDEPKLWTEGALDDNGVDEIEDVLFPELTRRGFDIEKLVFTSTGLVHPIITYSDDSLKQDPSLLRKTTKKDAIEEILRIVKTGEYTRDETEYPGTMNVGGWNPGYLFEFLKKFPESSYLDFILGAPGRDSLDSSLEDAHYAVYVVFHLDHLEEIQRGVYKIKDSENRKDAVAAVIGMHLDALVDA